MAQSTPPQRTLRVGEIVRHQLAHILMRDDLDHPDLNGVSITVTEVRMSPDLKTARCYCSPLGGGAELAGPLNDIAPQIRRRIGRTLSLKYTPKLVFLDDDSYENAALIDALLARAAHAKPTA